VGDPLFQRLQKSTAGNRAGARNSGSNARERQVARLLLGDDLCGFSVGRELRGRQPRRSIALPDGMLSWSPQHQFDSQGPQGRSGDRPTASRLDRSRNSPRLEERAIRRQRCQFVAYSRSMFIMPQNGPEIIRCCSRRSETSRFAPIRRARAAVATCC